MFTNDLTIICHSAMKGGLSLDAIIIALREKADALESLKGRQKPVEPVSE